MTDLCACDNHVDADPSTGDYTGWVCSTDGDYCWNCEGSHEDPADDDWEGP